MTQFSQDGRWWWNGSEWMPAQSPDGRAAVWTGSRWLRSASSLGTTLGIAAGLWLLEVAWLVVAVILLVFAANEEYVARGQTGQEDIAATSISTPVFSSLLIVPLIITVFVSARSRHWWIGPLVGGAVPSMVAILVHSSSAPVPPAIVLVSVPSAYIAAGWIANRLLYAPWALSADGQWWRNGRAAYSAISADGRWRWDGLTWQHLRPGGQ